jgi:hypothetical protein
VSTSRNTCMQLLIDKPSIALISVCLLTHQELLLLVPSGTVTSASLELLNATCKHTAIVEHRGSLKPQPQVPAMTVMLQAGPWVEGADVLRQERLCSTSVHVCAQHPGQQGGGGKLRCACDTDRGRV